MVDPISKGLTPASAIQQSFEKDTGEAMSYQVLNPQAMRIKEFSERLLNACDGGCGSDGCDGGGFD